MPSNKGRHDPDYKWAIHRKEWTDARRTVIARAGYRCQLCHSPRLEAWMPTEAINEWIRSNAAKITEGKPLEGDRAEIGAQVHHQCKVYRKPGESRASFLSRFCAMSNLICLCFECHKSIHSRDNTKDSQRENNERTANAITQDLYGEQLKPLEDNNVPKCIKTKRKRR